MTTPTVCPECHHRPSGRFDDSGAQCYCSCHDAADLAPAMLALLREWEDWAARGAYDYVDGPLDETREMLAKAEGK